MAREAVAGADGQDAERGLAADEALGGLVDRAVAADGEDDVARFALRAVDDAVEIFLARAANDLVLERRGAADDFGHVVFALRPERSLTRKSAFTALIRANEER